MEHEFVRKTLPHLKDLQNERLGKGKGLHFSPTAAETKQFASNAKKFVACAVLLDCLAVHPDGSYPNKVKAEKCWNLYECDIYGKQIGERFEVPAVAKKPVKKTAKRKVTKKR